MTARTNRDADSLSRGLVLGRMYEQGFAITTERVRRIFGVSRATAKRDLAAMRRQGCHLPKKPSAVAPIAALLARKAP